MVRGAIDSVRSSHLFVTPLTEIARIVLTTSGPPAFLC